MDHVDGGSHGLRTVAADQEQLASVITGLCGLHEHPGSVWSVIAVAPIFVWELSLGIWLVVKGFGPSPIIPTSVQTAPVHAPQPVA